MKITYGYGKALALCLAFIVVCIVMIYALGGDPFTGRMP